MVARLIHWSAHNVVFVPIAAALATLAGLYSLTRISLDAIPDLSDTQVIVYTEYPDQAPQVIKDQATFALTTAMLSVPHARVVRGFSYFGSSFVYVIFEDGTDIYWAHSRVFECLNVAAHMRNMDYAPLYRSAIGFDHFFDLLDSAGKLETAENWPPYDIITTSIASVSRLLTMPEMS